MNNKIEGPGEVGLPDPEDRVKKIEKTEKLGDLPQRPDEYVPATRGQNIMNLEIAIQEVDNKIPIAGDEEKQELLIRKQQLQEQLNKLWSEE